MRDRTMDTRKEAAKSRLNSGPGREQNRDYSTGLESIGDEDIQKAIDGFRAAAALLAERESKAFRRPARLN